MGVEGGKGQGEGTMSILAVLSSKMAEDKGVDNNGCHFYWTLIICDQIKR